ncbi:MAG: ABC transporter permease [Tepidanaerobacteraceae bacterium]|jgi:ABC-type transport system involved in multi-copper enzyme maturation permease subunit|nr:ABC transporter permease [Tepidanaerobacteraceae bacterium]
MLTIAKYSFKEMLNKKALGLVILLTILYLTLYGFGLREVYLHGSSNEIYRAALSSQLISVGLYFANFIIAFLVTFSAVGALSGDVESGVMQALLVKPIRRREVVMGKFLGIGAMISLYSALFFTAIIALNKILGAKIIIQLPNLIQGMLLFILGPIILLSVALWGSSRLSTLNTGILVVMLYGFAMVGGMLEQVGYMMAMAGHKIQGLVNVGIISSLIMPSDVIFRKMNSVLFTSGGMDFLTGGFLGAGFEPSIWMMIYTACYIIAALYMSARYFEKRDI